MIENSAIGQLAAAAERHSRMIENSNLHRLATEANRVSEMIERVLPRQFRDQQTRMAQAVEKSAIGQLAVAYDAIEHSRLEHVFAKSSKTAEAFEKSAFYQMIGRLAQQAEMWAKVERSLACRIVDEYSPESNPWDSELSDEDEEDLRATAADHILAQIDFTTFEEQVSRTEFREEFIEADRQEVVEFFDEPVLQDDLPRPKQTEEWARLFNNLIKQGESSTSLIKKQMLLSLVLTLLAPLLARCIDYYVPQPEHAETEVIQEFEEIEPDDGDS